MNFLLIAQYMAAASFLTISMTHLVIWVRLRQETLHILFAMSAACAGFNAIAESGMYRAESIDSMSNALRWYVTTSGLWGITTVLFLVGYTKVGRPGKTMAAIVIAAFSVALIINLFSPASYLYTELTGLRNIRLPWGERFHLAVGENNPFRAVTELPLLAMPILVGYSVYKLWKRGEHGRAWIFGITTMTFLTCFGTHAYLIDTARLDSPYLSTYGFLALVSLMSYDLAGEVVKQRDLEFRLRQTKSELQTAVADERDRIAADLHDSVTQTLFSTAAIADALPQVWQRDPKLGERGLQDLRHMTKGALAEMRTLLLELHPASLVEKDLGDLLHQLADATAGRSRIVTNVDIQGQQRFSDKVQVALYRVAQEALNNVIKHSEASHAWVALKHDADGVELTVRDDGRGFDPDDEVTGMGLGLMRQRIESIQGKLQVESRIRQGTTVRVYSTPGKRKNGDHEL